MLSQDWSLGSWKGSRSGVTAFCSLHDPWLQHSRGFQVQYGNGSHSRAFECIISRWRYSETCRREFKTVPGAKSSKFPTISLLWQTLPMVWSVIISRELSVKQLCLLKSRFGMLLLSAWFLFLRLTIRNWLLTSRASLTSQQRLLGKKRQVVIAKIKQLRDDLKDIAFEMNSLMEELKVVRKESLIEKFVAGLSMDILQLHLWGTHICMVCMATFKPHVFSSFCLFIYLFTYFLFLHLLFF